MKKKSFFYVPTLKFLRLTPTHTVGGFFPLKNPGVFSVQDSFSEQRSGWVYPTNFKA